MTNQESLLILNAISGVGNASIRKLIRFFGSPQRVLTLGQADLEAAGILSPEVIQNILKFPKDNFLKSEYNLVTLNNVRVICEVDDEYPERLSAISDAPVLLYVKGHNIREESERGIAIVGSRSASLYGTSMAEQFGVRLGEMGFCVLSGLARGIDTAAHKGALKAGAKTIAVLGSGLAQIYPPENEMLFEQISDQGAVVSEFPMTFHPLPYNFPRRNRIVSGLSLGVIVVEAAEKSGALITADFALEQGREVFVIPGKADNLYARGSNRLIQQGAKLIMCVEDVVEELVSVPPARFELDAGRAGIQGPSVPNGIQGHGDTGTPLSDLEQTIYQCISTKSVHLDDLSQQSGVSLAVLTPILLQLELKKLIKQLPGKYFQK